MERIACPKRHRIDSVTAEAPDILQWTGIPSNETDGFSDTRVYGEIASLENAFKTGLRTEGPQFSDTVHSIEGQFYGEGGSDVVGTFNQGGYRGSWGRIASLL